MNWQEIKAWRKAQRALLVARREALGETERKSMNERITSHLLDGFEVPRDAVVAFCWPYRAEFDARFAVRRWREAGAIAALPEVVKNGAPLQFRKWWPGAPMRPGVYDIPFPDGTEIVLPDIAIVPMNGFDASGYRLGYGGGFFDRTLAASDPRPIAVGVSYEALRLDHDLSAVSRHRDGFRGDREGRVRRRRPSARAARASGDALPDGPALRCPRSASRDLPARRIQLACVLRSGISGILRGRKRGR